VERVAELTFPDGFLWGAATAAHQVEGGNEASDWWQWERAPGTPVREPSGNACEHWTRYPADIGLLAGLGLNTYRFSVEWARIEPEPGRFDDAALAHYRQVADTVIGHGLTPMVTLHHFTLPAWVADRGGWTDPGTPALFDRYCRAVLERLEPVRWFCTVNEPTTVATGGYLDGWGFPPGVRDRRQWRRAVDGLIEGHRRAVAAVHEVRPGARAGLAAYSCETDTNAGARPAAEYATRINEDVYLDATGDDDFIGVQTYTRFTFRQPWIAAPLTRLVLAVPPLERRFGPGLARRGVITWGDTIAPEGARVTQMQWEFRPQAVAAAVRRIAARYPGKDLIVTEHGLATADDTEREEFIGAGLAALHEVLAEGIPLRGYLYWSLLDNYEWAQGYGPTFGLIGVDRATQERTVRPSARLLGDIARHNRVIVPE
jgi:beta-glucosidase